MTLSSKFAFPVFYFLLCLIPLGWLWFVLINDQRVEWTVNPQYGYGWAVPFLCLFLAWQRVRSPNVRTPPLTKAPNGNGLWLLSFCLLAFLYAPTRLVEEANPGWRLVSWALAIEVVGLTLLFFHFNASKLQRYNLSVRTLAFPICYFLVAVPWPTVLEQPLIQGLTRMDTNLTTELLGWLGIPAMPHGNVIEVATSMVGIDEACSGIRSFQATLMISLFFGQFYRLSVFRRAVLCLAGFALSFLFNLAQMSLLVWVAARKGIAAIASWHDPAGVTILVACFVCLWGMGVLFKNGCRKPETGNENAERPKAETRKEESGRQPFAFGSLAIALGVWIVLTEFSVEGWYRWHEARVPRAVQWTVAWPTNNPTFEVLPLPGTTRQILRYDEGQSARWSDSNFTWRAVFLRWKPGRTAIHLAENHTPNVCMTGAGYELDSITPQEWFDANGLRMPFSVNEVVNAPAVLRFLLLMR
jgi:exosortase